MRLDRGRAAVLGMALGLGLPFAGPAAAADLLSITLVLGGGCEVNCTASRTFGDVEALVDTLTASGYRSINPQYRDNSVATAFVNYRGVAAELVYPGSGPEVEFRIPRLNYSRVFDTRRSRGGNEQALEDFLRENGDGLLSDILGLAVATTGTDPIAGNPNSLMSKMVEQDFLLGTTISPFPDPLASSGAGNYERAQERVGVNARFGRFQLDGSNSDVVDLPLNYVLPLEDPRYAINFDLPLTYVETEGAVSYAGSFGIGVRLPLLDNWTLTPAVRAGLAGSFDLGSVSGVLSASLTSNYRFSLNDLDVSLGNSLAYIQTVPIEFDGTSVDYDQQNLVLRNGIAVSGPLDYKLFGQRTTWEVAVVNTHFLGDDVFVTNYTDIAISFGTQASVNGFTWDSFRFGLTYTFSTDSDLMGLRANFGYNF